MTYEPLTSAEIARAKERAESPQSLGFVFTDYRSDVLGLIATIEQRDAEIAELCAALEHARVCNFRAHGCSRCGEGVALLARIRERGKP